MVCGLPRLLRSLAMTKGANGSDFFFFSVFGSNFLVYGLLRCFAPRNDKKENYHCETLYKEWQSRLFLTCHCENRRCMAISGWQPPHTTHTIIANDNAYTPSLRRPKAWGNPLFIE